MGRKEQGSIFRGGRIDNYKSSGCIGGGSSLGGTIGICGILGISGGGIGGCGSCGTIC